MWEMVPAGPRPAGAESRGKGMLFSLGGSFGGPVGQSDGSVVGSQILARHSLNIGCRDLIDIIDGSKQLSPVSVVGLKSRQQLCESGVAVQLPDQACARFRLGAGEGGVIHKC